MRRLQGRERPLLCDSAPPLIQVRDEHPECALSKSRPDELRLAEPCLCFGHAGEARLVKPVVHRFPKRKPFRVARVVGLERHDVRRPTRRNGNPVGLIEEERLSQDTAADLEINPITRIDPPIPRNSGAHLMSGTRTVRLAKRFPGQRTWQRVCVSEDATADDHVARRVEFE
jgi:hypothetical protein